MGDETYMTNNDSNNKNKEQEVKKDNPLSNNKTSLEITEKLLKETLKDNYEALKRLSET